MTYLILIVVAVAIAIFDDRMRGRKKVPPPTVPQDIPRPRQRSVKNERFEIPPLRGIPADMEITVDAEVLRAQELREKWETAQREAQRTRMREQRAVRRAAAEEREAVAAVSRSVVPHAAAFLPQLTPDLMKQAVVLSEVLGKPRALRKFPRR